MPSPFERSPVSTIVLPGISVNLQGLIVLVGPNSSGKTNLLRDVHAAASGSPRTLVVAERINYRPVPALNDYLAFLTETGDIERRVQPNGIERYRKRGHQYGTQAGAGGEWNRDELERFYGEFMQFSSSAHGKTFPANTFLQQLGVLECSALFIEQRLILTASASPFDTHETPAGSALQALRLNFEAQERLTQETLKAFQRGVWLDLSAGATLPIRVSDTDFVPSFKERSDPVQMKRYRIIETEGEGIRSYVAVCITLLLAKRPLCLIDEPEMCLHPPQAQALGRMVGEHGSTEHGCTLVATHSSDVLRGILEANPEAGVIRLTRSVGSFRGRHVSSEILREASTRPFSRSETILNGLFTDGVVLCESDGDREVYESSLHTFEPPQPDVRFIPVGGVGGFRESVRLYRALGVPVAIAADFDFLFRHELPAVLEELAAPASVISNLSKRINNFAKQVRATTPELSPDAAIKELKPLLDDASNWDDLQKEAELKSKLNKIIGRLNRLALLKSKGTDGVPAPLMGEIHAMLEELRKYGVFLVPRGELESWVPDLMKDTTKENKALWATEAARKIEECGHGDDDIWDFVKDIVAFIKSSLEVKA